jgi:hypothetical protein
MHVSTTSAHRPFSSRGGSLHEYALPLNDMQGGKESSAVACAAQCWGHQHGLAGLWVSMPVPAERSGRADEG